MSVIKREWPVGTRYAVKVISPGSRVLIVTTLTKPYEAFTLVNHGVFPIPPMDARGFIERTDGGKAGLYWRWRGASEQSELSKN